MVWISGVLLLSAAEERVWTGVNGRTFKGSFHAFSEDRTKAVFLTSDGRQIAVGIDNLVAEDRERLLNPVAPVKPAANGGGFKEIPDANRSLIPSLSPKSFGGSDNESLTDAVWISMLWWQKAGVLEVPKSGDDDSKAEWLHKQLGRALSRGGRSAASLDSAKEVVEEFFVEHHKETATVRASILNEKLSLMQMVATLKGADAVIMNLTISYQNERDFSICTVLEQLTPKGEFAFHVFGRRFHGKVVTAADGTHEFSILNREDLPSHYATQGAKFYYKSSYSWNGLLVIQPHPYAVKGSPSPLPPEGKPATSSGSRPAPSLPGALHPQQLAVDWKSPACPERDWTLSDGTRFTGTYAYRKADLHVLKNSRGTSLEVSLDQLPPDQRAALLFQSGCSGVATAKRLQLAYRFITPKKESIEVLISSEGSLGRLEIPSEKFVFLFDLADGAFASFWNHDPANPKPSSFGRYETELLLHGESSRLEIPAGLLETLTKTTLPRSKTSKVAGFDARSFRFPQDPDGPSMQNLQVDGVAIDPPVVLTAISHLLMPRGSSLNASYYSVRSDMSCHYEFDWIEPCLARTRVLPLRMSWTNKVNDRYTEPEMRLLTSGDFSLELVKAEVPDSFPDRHFDIPAEARRLEQGKMIKN